MPTYKKYQLKSKTNKDGKALRPESRWMVKGYLGLDPDTGLQKSTALRGFKTKLDAERAFSDAKYRLQHRVAVKKHCPRVQAAYEQWIPLYAETVAPSTLRLVKTVYRTTILPKFANYYLDKITLLEVQKWANDLAKKYRSCRKIVSMLSLLCRFGIQNGWLDRNPTQYVQWPRNQKAPSAHVKDNYFDRTELNQFLTALSQRATENPDWLVRKAYLFLLATTGMRSGEATALKWSDLDIDGATVSIRYHMQVQANGTPDAVPGAKTDAGVRDLPLEPQAAAALKQWHVYQASRTGIGDNWIFTTPWRPTTRVSMTTMHNWMRDACNAAGVRYRSLHALRHTKATLLSENGTGIGTISSILGHSSPTITAQAYVHSTTAGMLAAEEAYSKLITPSGSFSGSL
ncbi:tyrosine-type recombinase/integrase [Lacticaseibacillus mingshuiensis]|uniref:tyrosine-type recombinase/integrase n=1 Tax=Lacticaseibacillus mingshuiensis TaxID=2799574 RepID=UPI0019509EDE|nr:site-specific integrase [Lacticaseibacillus mingshuiensis]